MITARQSRIFALAIGLTALGLVSACTSTGPTVPTGDATGLPSTIASQPSAPASPTSAPGVVAVLTGGPGSASALKRPAVAVPIMVGHNSAGPAGLSAADLVEAEFVEGGAVRLVGVFQSQTSSRVGPVSALRPSDVKLLGQLHPYMAQSGTTSGFMAVAKAAGVANADSGTGFLSFHGRRYVDTSKLLSSGPSSLSAPARMLQYAQGAEALSSKDVHKITKVSIETPGHTTMVWTFDAKARLWRSSVGGTKVSTTNLLMLRTPYKSKFVSAAHSTFTWAIPQGTGSATLVSAGQSVSATWYKQGTVDALNFLGPDKSAPLFDPGASWLFMLPSGTKVKTS
jgi:hypothetical protein